MNIPYTVLKIQDGGHSHFYYREYYTSILLNGLLFIIAPL